MEIQIVTIEEIKLIWSEWYRWHDIDTNKKSLHKVDIPYNKSGVYEAKYASQEKRLTIGKTVDLQKRIRRGMVRGKIKHSTGKKIREVEDLAQIVVRWAETNRPAAVEEDLHQKHLRLFNALPVHVDKT